MPSPLRREERRLKDLETPLPLFKQRKESDWSYVPNALYETRKRLGLQEHPVATGYSDQGDANPDDLFWSRVRLLLREPFLEFWGVFILVLLGDSATAQTYLSKQQYGSWVNICFSWAIGVMFGIYVAGDSGAYLNPAVTLTNCIFRGVPLRRFPPYVAAQFLGGLCAAGVVYAQYVPAIDHYEGHGVRTVPPVETSSAKSFASFPAQFVPRASQFVSEFIGNFTTTFCIFALRDENGADLKGGGGFFTLALFFLNFALVSSFGWQTGSPINPGRDISGRIFLSMVGYGREVWTAGGYFFWIPTFVPFVACLAGAWAYDVFIYTGSSPINTPGLGVYQMLHSFRSREQKRNPGDEEGQNLQSEAHDRGEDEEKAEGQDETSTSEEESEGQMRERRQRVALWDAATQKSEPGGVEVQRSGGTEILPLDEGQERDMRERERNTEGLMKHKTKDVSYDAANEQYTGEDDTGSQRGGRAETRLCADNEGNKNERKREHGEEDLMRHKTKDASFDAADNTSFEDNNRQQNYEDYKSSSEKSERDEYEKEQEQSEEKVAKHKIKDKNRDVAKENSVDDDAVSRRSGEKGNSSGRPDIGEPGTKDGKEAGDSENAKHGSGAGGKRGRDGSEPV